MGVRTQKVQLANGALTATVNLLSGGNVLPDNIVVCYQGSATLEGTETLDIQGYHLGCETVITTDLVAQITVAASNVVRLDMSSTAKGCWQLLFTASALAADETMDIAVTTW
jgi:hypothetical protein